MAVLAGALLAGGSAHSIAGADGFRPVKLAPVSTANPVGPIGPERLPFLALAAVEPPPAPPMAAPVAVAKPAVAIAQPVPAPPKRLAAPRRDLAGFLAEQGHALRPIADEREETSRLIEENEAGADADALPSAKAAPVLAAAEVPRAEPQPTVAQSFPTLSVGGMELGAVTMRGDTVHLSALLGLLQLRMPAEEFARLKASPAAESFVSLATLREAGLAVTVDPQAERLTLAAL